MDNTDKELKQDRKAVERQCLISRETLPKEELFRFVASPDNRVVFDLNEKLPGKGMWIRAQGDILEKAIKSNVFGKYLKKNVTIGFTMDSVVQALKGHLLEMLALCNKAGTAVAGFEKVKEAFAKGSIFLLVLAKDSSQNSEKKIQSYLNKAEVIRVFNKEDLGHIFSKDEAAFVALKPGRISRKFLQEARRLENVTSRKEEVKD